MNDSYKKLNVYIEARKLVVNIYDLIKGFPIEERYALADQMRRAVISVPSNIAEGLSRTAPKEQAHFLDISYGSLMELDCQLDICNDLGYISLDKRQSLNTLVSEIARMLRSLKMQRTSQIITSK